MDYVDVCTGVLCFEPMDLDAIMKVAQRIEDINLALTAKISLGPRKISKPNLLNNVAS